MPGTVWRRFCAPQNEIGAAQDFSNLTADWPRGIPAAAIAKFCITSRPSHISSFLTIPNWQILLVNSLKMPLLRGQWLLPSGWKEYLERRLMRELGPLPTNTPAEPIF